MFKLGDVVRRLDEYNGSIPLDLNVGDTGVIIEVRQPIEGKTVGGVTVRYFKGITMFTNTQYFHILELVKEGENETNT